MEVKYIELNGHRNQLQHSRIIKISSACVAVCRCGYKSRYNMDENPSKFNFNDVVICHCEGGCCHMIHHRCSRWRGQRIYAALIKMESKRMELNVKDNNDR